MKWRNTQTLVSGDTSEEDLGHTYLGTLMYGRYQRDLSEAAREEARRLRRVRKKRRKDDKLRQKELEATGKFKPRGKVYKVLSSLWRHTFARLGEDWIIMVFLGISMACINFAIDQGIAICNSARMWMYKDVATTTFSQYVAWVSLPICLILFAAGFVHVVAAQSIGSGIPEMKTILRGVHLKEYLTFKALVSKMVGLTATLGSGLPLGKEGPSVHIASMVASLLSRMMTTFQGVYANESRTNEMLAAACAVGVASCFAAPVGGVLFSIEVTTTYFAVRNYWRGFFAACCSAIMFRLLSVWSGATPTIKPLFPTTLPEEYPFDPQEFAVYVLLGIVSGLLAALWIYLHRHYVLFMRNTKVLSNFLQKNRFIYPGIATWAIMSILFPPGIGKYMAGGVPSKGQVLALFANFTWGAEDLTADQAAVVANWQTPDVNIFGCLVIYFFSIYFLSMISCTLPVPAGIFVPAFKMGASLGRFTGEIMHYFCPLGVAYGGRIQKILPGGYATVGAAAFTGAVTHTVSTMVIIIEMTGQLTHTLPIMAAVLAANATATLLQPSVFDSIILIKKLPYLPDLLSSASRMYDICVEDFMVRDVKYIWHRMTFQQLKDILKENKAITSFPLVDSPSSMVLLGSIHRWELVRVIERQVGRARRLQVAALWLREAERRRREEDARRTRRPSRFEVTPALDMLQVPGAGMTRGSSLTTQDQGGLIPAPGQLFRPKSILKKTNSFTLTRGLGSPGAGPQTPTSPQPNVYTTVTGAETRIRAAFEAIFKRSSLLPDVEGGLPEQADGLARSPSINKKVQLPRERVCDMSPEDQQAWERLEMAKEIDYDRMLHIARKRDMQQADECEYEDESLYTCHIDPAPFQLVERTSLLKVHSLFSTLGVKRAYVTAIGRLIGVVSLKELRKAIEDVNSGTLTVANRPEPPTTPLPTMIKVQTSEPAPDTDSETAKLTTGGSKK